MTITLVKALAFAFTLSVASPPLHAQKSGKANSETSIQNLPKITKTSLMGNFYASFGTTNFNSDFLIAHFGEWLGTDSNHTFKLIKEDKDDLGIKHLVYEHYYKGVKVMDDIILLHEKLGKLISVNGEIVTNISLTANTPLTSEKIKSIISADLNADNKLKLSNAEEVITKVNKGRTVELYHTSKVEALALKPLKAFTYYIDNSSRTIVKKISRLHDTDTPSVSATYYKGNQSITVDSYNGQYRLKDNARNIHTMDGTNFDIDSVNNVIIGVTEYLSNTPDYNTDPTKPPVEVHWGMKNAYDYYISRHNRSSYDGNGSKIDNYYNFDFGGLTGGANAAALDTPLYGGIVCMLYGNGKIFNGLLTFTNPVVGLDVAGHEYSHLIIGRNGLGGLNYQGESGAINESIADMLGTSIEFYSGVDPNWTIGEGIPTANVFTPSPSPYFRSMSNPNDVDPGPQPDTYNGTNWAPTANPDENNDWGGVHTNSGVGNFWFYLLSVGGSGANDIGTSFNVNGITIEKSEKIIYRALTLYMTPNETYLDAYNATKLAAADLYGTSSNEVQQVENAWCAVGIGTCANILAVNESVKTDSQNIKIYPNPVRSSQFTIDNNTNENGTYEIYDFSGKIVQKASKLDKGENKVNISGVQSGVYLVKINTNGKIISKKLIIE